MKENYAQLQAAFDRRAASELPGGGRMTLEEMKAVLGALQSQRQNPAISAQLAAQYQVQPSTLTALAQYYSLAKVTTGSGSNNSGMVAEWQ